MKRRTANDMPAFREEWWDTECWICGLPLDQHGSNQYDCAGTIDHIAGRNHSDCHHRTNLLWAAWRCHREVIPGMSMIEKVNRKLAYDPAGFDEVLFAAIRQSKGGRIDF